MCLCALSNVKKTIDISKEIQKKPDSGGINRKRNRDFNNLKTKIGKEPLTSKHETVAERKKKKRKVTPKTVKTPMHAT